MSWLPAESSSRNISSPPRWTCPNCSASNLSYTYDIACPFCFQPRQPGSPAHGGLQEAYAQALSRLTWRDEFPVGLRDDDVATGAKIRDSHGTIPQSILEPFGNVLRKKEVPPIVQQNNALHIRREAHHPPGTIRYPGHPSANWVKYRNIVTHIYIIEDLPLKKDAESMREVYHFHTNQVMFQHHFRRWVIQESLWGSSFPNKSESLVILRFAERLMRGIYFHASASSAMPTCSGASPSATANQALDWLMTFGLTQTSISCATLTAYFGHHPNNLDPHVWAIADGFSQALRVTRPDTRLADVLIHFINQFISSRAPHPFHDIYHKSRQRGSDEVSELSRTVVGWHIVVTLSRYFPEKETVLKTIRDLSRDNARPFLVNNMPDSHATAQRAFEKVATEEAPAETQTEHVVYHLHQDKYLNDIEVDVAGFLLLLPEKLRYDLQLEKLPGHPCWTCIPPDATPSYSVPLTIANLPVVLPVRTYYPLHAGLTPPKDPHPRQISPVGQLADDTVESILDTFEEAVGFYLLINGMLQIIIPEDFDITSALNHYPRHFGGLKVSYIPRSQIPTAGEANKRRKISITQWLNVGISRNPMTPLPQAIPSGSGYGNIVSLNPTGPLPGSSLVIGSSVQAQVNRSNSQVRHHQAKLGLMTKRQDRVYLTLPTHLITQALTDSELDWVWPESGLQDVRLVAGDNDVDLGRIAKTFDTDARAFPDGFEHDVSLVDVSSIPETVTNGMRPGLALDWLSVQGWSNLQLNTKNVFLLDDRDRTAKSIGIRDHQTQMVGQGILINRQRSKPRGLRNILNFRRQNGTTLSDIEACKHLVARSILYRVARAYDAPDGQSGTPVCILDESELGVLKGKVAGFTSYVQMVQDIQHYHIEGDQLANMLEHGRVAFYGAFRVPQEMTEEHVIA